MTVKHLFPNIGKVYDAIYMVTITGVIINHDEWIKYTISFSAGTLITHITDKCVSAWLLKSCPGFMANNQDLLKNVYQAPALPSELFHLLLCATLLLKGWEPLS